MTTTHYEIDDFHGHVTEDHFEDGEIGTSQLKEYSVVLSHATIAGLLEQVTSEFDTKIEDIELDACEDIGRIDVQVMEDADGMIIRVGEPIYRRWVNGEARLYSVTYSGTLRKVITDLSWKDEAIFSAPALARPSKEVFKSYDFPNLRCCDGSAWHDWSKCGAIYAYENPDFSQEKLEEGAQLFAKDHKPISPIYASQTQAFLRGIKDVHHLVKKVKS